MPVYTKINYVVFKIKYKESAANWLLSFGRQSRTTLERKMF